MKNLIIIIFILARVDTFCQTSDEDMHRKYWYFKSHLNNDFIKVGLNNGESMPFNEKNTFNPNPSATMDLNWAPKLHAGEQLSD